MPSTEIQKRSGIATSSANLMPRCHTTLTSFLATRSTAFLASWCGPDLIVHMGGSASLKCTFPRMGAVSAQTLLPVANGVLSRRNMCGLLLLLLLFSSFCQQFRDQCRSFEPTDGEHAIFFTQCPTWVICPPPAPHAPSHWRPTGAHRTCNRIAWFTLSFYRQTRSTV
jgi:hypothetical protein